MSETASRPAKHSIIWTILKSCWNSFPLNRFPSVVMGNRNSHEVHRLVGVPLSYAAIRCIGRAMTSKRLSLEIHMSVRLK